MRSTSLVLATLAGIAATVVAAPAGAFTPNSSAGIRAAAESVDSVANVHCRSYKHRSYNHGWGFGCGRGAYSVGVHRRGMVEEREGRGVRERSTIRSETNVRSRESTRTRGEVRTGGRSETRTGGGGSGTSGGGGSTGQSSGGQR